LTVANLKLSGEQIEQLQSAILGAFEADELRQFLLTHLDKYLSHISLGPNLKVVVLDVITQAEREGWTEDLLDAVADERPDRSDLQALCDRLRSGRRRLSEIPNPYRGLEFFDVAHAANYFGRAAMVDKLVKKLKQANFVAVVGPSGCGKSSLVRAGLLPALSAGALPGSAAWQWEIFWPGNDPMRALATALVNRLDPDLSEVDRLAEARKLADGLRSGALPAADVLARLHAKSPHVPRLLLIADQFEEAFTLCTDDEARRAFVDTLLAAAEAEWITVLFTLRADFYGRVLETEHFGKRVDAGLVNVLPMSREERREAVEQPAVQAGCRFEEGLVERILDAVEGAPGDLPLLEFALTEMWERQTADGMLTHAAYDAIGEVRGAIAKRADDTFKDLDAGQQAAVRAIFTRLVQVARPDEAGQDARRRIDLAELQPESRTLAQRLADARLLVTGRDPTSGDETVEVAHEALIRGWKQLQEWLNRDREFLLWRQRLGVLANIWEKNKRSEGALLGDVLLREAQVRSEGREDDLNDLELAFIADSAALRDREREAERKRQSDRLRLIARAAVGMGILALLALVFAVRAQNSANIATTREAELRAASTRAVASEGTAIAERSTAQAASTRAVEALEIANKERETAFVQQLAAVGEAEMLSADANATRKEVAFERQLVGVGRAEMPSFDPDASTVGILLIIESLNRIPTTLQGQGAWARVLEHFPPMKLMGEVRYPEVRMGGHGASPVMATSRDGELLAVRSRESLQVFNLSTGRLEFEISSSEGDVVALAFAPDKSTLALGGADGVVRLWLLESQHTRVTNGEIHPPGGVQALAFSGNNRYLATGSLSNEFAYVWNADSGDLTSELDHGTGDVWGVALNDDASRLVSSGWNYRIEENVARVWDIFDQPKVTQRVGGDVRDIAFSADGELLATGGWDGGVQIWSIQERHDFKTGMPELVSVPFAQIPIPDEWTNVRAVALDPIGNRVAAASNGVVQVWDYRTGRVVSSVEHGDVLLLEFVNDGAQLVSASQDMARLWNMDEGRTLGDTIRISATPVLEEPVIRDMIDQICARLERNLTQAEWKSYLPDKSYRSTCPNLPPGE
jgi:energy-coupling factor transporter ATP-binding protein EcfA2